MNQGISNAQPAYYPAFDGLRAIAALAVIVGHAAAIGHPVRWTGCAFIAVRFFFVLSGFLITGILIDHVLKADSPWKSLKSFYIRRMLRLCPPYFAFLLFFLVIGNEFVFKTIAWTATYTSNFCFAYFTRPRPPLSHFWTLAVEEQFYLVWPILLLLLSKKRVALLSIVGIGILGGFVYREVAEHFDATRQQILYPPIASLDSLLMGALAAMLMRGQSTAAHTGLKLLRFAGLYLAIPFLTLGLISAQLSWNVWFDLTTDGQFTTALASVGIVILFATGQPENKIGNFLCSRPMRFLGTISYGLYVYHFPLDRIVYEQILMKQYGVADSFVLHSAFVLATTLIVSTLSWYLLERPVLRLKRHFPYAPT